jgi:hypothetical protein
MSIDVTGIGCLVIIDLVTGIAFTGDARIGTTFMTLVTVIDRMSPGEREKSVIQLGSGPVPAETVDGVAFNAVC